MVPTIFRRVLHLFRIRMPPSSALFGGQHLRGGRHIDGRDLIIMRVAIDLAAEHPNGESLGGGFNPFEQI